MEAGTTPDPNSAEARAAAAQAGNPPADAAALAQAGAQAAVDAPAGTSPDEMRKLVKEAVKEAADERGSGITQEDAAMIAGAVVSGLESKGAFNPPPEPVEQPPNPEAGNEGNAQSNTDNGNAGQEEPPRKKTFAEKHFGAR